MDRTTCAVCLAFVIGLLSPLTTETRAQPKEAEKRQPEKVKEIYTIVKVQLYEVDEAFYKRVARARRLSKEDLEKLEQETINPPRKNQPEPPSVFELLKKQKLLLTGKEINIDPGQEDLLLDSSKAITCLPSPDQLQKGQKALQTFQEGMSLRAQIQISPDRRFVRLKFMEKSLELESVEKVSVVEGQNGKEVVGEIAFLKESGLSWVRDIPDGGSILLPIQYRPRAARENDRWWVAQVVPRIYIEAEERERRRPVPK